MLKPKPWWLRATTGSYVWVTLAPNIYHPERDDPQSFPWLIAHESIHIAQQNQTGLYGWLWKYFTQKSFCFSQEVEAMRVELAAHPEQDRPARVIEMAQQLSGSMYRRCSTYDQAMAALI